LKGRPATKEARQRIIDAFNLQYYFGGQEFAYKETDHGVEVLAVGSEEIRALFRRLPPEERQTVILGFADPW
jgi:hypothetical protein